MAKGKQKAAGSTKSKGNTQRRGKDVTMSMDDLPGM